MPRFLTAALAVTIAITAGAACSSSSSANGSPQRSATTTTAAAPVRTVAEQAAYDAQLSTFATTLNVSGVLDTIGRRGGRYTVFAPDNDAFARLRHAEFVALLTRRGRQHLARLLDGHVVNGLVLPQKLASGRLKALDGQTLTVTKTAHGFVLTDARGHRAAIEMPPLVASNGVIYKIDHVLGDA